MKLRYSLFVLIGGALGASARYATNSAFDPSFNQQLIALCIENTMGSLLLGFLTASFVARKEKVHIQLLIGTGFCGSYTTMSALAGLLHIFIKNGELPSLFIGIGYAFLSLIAGISAAWGGFMLGRKRFEEKGDGDTQ